MSNVILLAPRVDQEAVSQLKTCSSLEGIESAVGMPSLTIGARYPKGSVFRSKSTCIHPYLIGPDIGNPIALLT